MSQRDWLYLILVVSVALGLSSAGAFVYFAERVGRTALESPVYLSLLVVFVISLIVASYAYYKTTWRDIAGASGLGVDGFVMFVFISLGLVAVVNAVRTFFQ